MGVSGILYAGAYFLGFVKDKLSFLLHLGAFYDKQNNNITSFQGKTNDERDRLILEDLFKISLDSNNKSLRDFASIILEGKQLTTRIQGDPDSKISTLTTEELALLNQYRDTLFDLHNLTKEIEITPPEAVLGCNKDIKTLHGNINIKIPAGVSSGQALRLKGLGLPSAEGYGVLNAKIKRQPYFTPTKRACMSAPRGISFTIPNPVR